MNEAYLILGGNIADRMEYLNRAKEELLVKPIRIIRLSSIYESEPWGSESQLYYLNQVIQIETSLSAEALLENIKMIEQKLKRIRSKTNRNADRTIDIDILFYNLQIITSDELEIPHPRLHLRKFVLVPMMELDPFLMHPIIHKTIKEILQQCDDPLKVKLFDTL
jgi:2-amino-4-hydroxy-6-hydroxymethyldihydropteridine diphosphokinase